MIHVSPTLKPNASSGGQDSLLSTGCGAAACHACASGRYIPLSTSRDAALGCSRLRLPTTPATFTEPASSWSRLTCRNTPLLATMTRCPFSIAGKTPNKGAAKTGHARCSAWSRRSIISLRIAIEQLSQRRLHRHQHLFRKLRELAVEHVF